MSNVPVFWSRIVTISALLGLAPFAAGLILTISPGFLPFDPVVFERAMLGYGALILGFLGGVRWGIRMQGGAGSDLTFVMGILGAVVGFFTLLMPYSLGLIILTMGFAAQGAWDVWSGFRGGVPQLYAQLRNMMTWLVCLILIAIVVARALIPG